MGPGEQRSHPFAVFVDGKHISNHATDHDALEYALGRGEQSGILPRDRSSSVEVMDYRDTPEGLVCHRVAILKLSVGWAQVPFDPVSYAIVGRVRL